MEFIDFEKRQRSRNIEVICPGWQTGEQVAFFSPHDDDVALGAGYLLTAVSGNGGTPHLIIFCQGDAGYSARKEKKTIVQRRKKETLECYRRLGVQKKNIHHLGIPDFSLMTYINRRLPRGRGLFEHLVKLLRRKNITRLVFSSGHFEHWDHTAVYLMGIYTSPQAGDPILIDLGEPSPIKSHLIYSVWGDFEPHPADLSGVSVDKGIIADAETESSVRTGIASFTSQAAIIEGIIAQREKRRSDLGYLELYKTAVVRKPIDYYAYLGLLKTCQNV